MTTIVTRAGKGSTLTFTETDANFTNLKNSVDDHIADTAGAHAASAISNTPAGTVAATTVQAAIDELATDAAALVSDTAYAASWDGVTTIAPSKNAVYDQMELKATIASPTFTGTPAAPTAAAGTNTTQLATTAFVTAAAGSSGALGNRNMIINGNALVNQRSASVTINSSTVQFASDRWGAAGISASGVFTWARSVATPNTAAGFPYFTRATCTTADASLAAGDIYYIRYVVEGQDMAHLCYGTSDAKTTTLSFWIRSSMTGTMGGAFCNSSGTRSYPFSFTINATNTWEQKSVTITGDTTGTWLNDTGVGNRITFSLAAGTTFSGTAGAWVAGNIVSATGATNFMVLNATVDIVGLQWELGSVATAFEHRRIGDEYALCQRYFQTGTRNFICYGAAGVNNGYAADYPVQMRVAPTHSTGTFGYVNASTGNTDSGTARGFRMYALTTALGGMAVSYDYVATAEL